MSMIVTNSSAFFISFLCITALSFMGISKSYASAFIPNIDEYKLVISMNAIDSNTIKEKQKRILLYQTLNHKLSILYKAINAENNNLKKIYKLHEQIKNIKKLQNMLSSYQLNKLYSSYIEYGATNQSSYGVKLTYTNNIFNKNFDNYMTEAFIKMQLLNLEKHKVTVGPKLIYDYSYNTICYELALTYAKLSTVMKKYLYIKEFTFSQLTSIDNNFLKNNCYSIAFSNIIKSYNNFMLINFTKISYRNNNANTIFQKLLYEEFSIAKEYNIKNLPITLKLGYFYEQSLDFKKYKISGTTFSMFFDL